MRQRKSKQKPANNATVNASAAAVSSVANTSVSAAANGALNANGSDNEANEKQKNSKQNAANDKEMDKKSHVEADKKSTASTNKKSQDAPVTELNTAKIWNRPIYKLNPEKIPSIQAFLKDKIAAFQKYAQDHIKNLVTHKVTKKQ